ncbi:MAG: ABC transporter permease [Bacillota bacterium]|nr:ABC transporter permease [Bacillota bacterium]
MGGLKRFSRRYGRNRVAVFGAAVLFLEILVAVLAPWLAPHDPTKLQLGSVLLPPGTPGHMLGTDEFGMDVSSRLIYGARISLTVGVVVVSISAALGIILGALAGYYGGWVDTLVMRAVDLLLAFPFFVLAIAIMAVLGPSLYNAMIALGVIGWTGYARIVRGQFLALREKEFVEGARSAGCSDLYIIVRHMLPNSWAPIIVQATLGLGGAILSASGLSFLGMGAQPPTPEWGAMLSTGQYYIRRAPWLTTYPGLAIMVTVLALNFVGDGLRDALDPRLKT